MAGGSAPGPRESGGIQTAPLSGAQRRLWRELWWSRWLPVLYSHLRGEVGTATLDETTFLPTPVELNEMQMHLIRLGKAKEPEHRNIKGRKVLASVLSLLCPSPDLTRGG